MSVFCHDCYTVELSFNELEYSKYLDEASSLQQQQQQQQDPSHYDEQQIQYAPTPDDTRYRTMPQNLQKQEHPQEAHQWQPEPAAPKVMPRFYGEENGPEELSPRSLPDYDEQLFDNRQGDLSFASWFLCMFSFTVDANNHKIHACIYVSMFPAGSTFPLNSINFVLFVCMCVFLCVLYHLILALNLETKSDNCLVAILNQNNYIPRHDLA